MHIVVSIWENDTSLIKIRNFLEDISSDDLINEILFEISEYTVLNRDLKDTYKAKKIICNMYNNGLAYSFTFFLARIHPDTIRQEVGYHVERGFKELGILTAYKESKESNMGILHTGDGHELYARVNPTAEAVRLKMKNCFYPFDSKIIIGEMPIPKIKKVIVSYPATIVFFDDKTKVVVKCQDDDVFDPEKGIAIAVMRKLYPKKYGDILSMKDKKITYVTEHEHHIETYKSKTKKK